MWQGNESFSKEKLDFINDAKCFEDENIKLLETNDFIKNSNLEFVVKTRDMETQLEALSLELEKT